MIHINRLPKPDILERKEKEWTEKFLNSDKERPDASKYRHKEILSQLMSSSHSKCFYCECLLKGEPSEIDHNIEVTIDRSKAFEWENLYLSCENCNNKLDENKIHKAEALDPCSDSNDTIRQNITFNDEQIIPYNNSEIGNNTIRKYRLDSQELDLKRSKQLHKLFSVLLQISRDMIKTGRKAMNNDEKDKLKVFISPYAPYSYMCLCYLRNLHIDL